MSDQKMNSCKKCQKMTVHLGPSTSHVLHLLLSIITGGLWVVVWMMVAWSNSTSAQCTECAKVKGILG